MSHALHTLIAGGQGSGKSHGAHQLAAHDVKANIPVFVHDPHGTRTAWPSSSLVYHFDSVELLIAALKKSQRVKAYIEESGESIGRGSDAVDKQWLATGSRKWGHVVTFICQEAQQILPVIRKNCMRGLIFRQSLTNAKLLANDFADDGLLRITSLQQYEFLYVERFKPCRVMRFPK